MNKTDKTPLTDAELDARLGQLSPRIEPENDLWAGIAGQLPEQHSPWRRGQMSIAASLLVGLLGLGLAGYSQWQNQQLRHELASSTPSSQPHNSAMVPVTYSSENNRSENNYGESNSCVQPDEFQVIQHNLAIIQSAMSEINSALEQAPNNPALNKRLLDLSKQQINLVNRANAIAL